MTQIIKDCNEKESCSKCSKEIVKIATFDNIIIVFCGYENNEIVSQAYVPLKQCRAAYVPPAHWGAAKNSRGAAAKFKIFKFARVF